MRHTDRNSPREAWRKFAAVLEPHLERTRRREDQLVGLKSETILTCHGDISEVGDGL